MTASTGPSGPTPENTASVQFLPGMLTPASLSCPVNIYVSPSSLPFLSRWSYSRLPILHTRLSTPQSTELY